MKKLKTIIHKVARFFTPGFLILASPNKVWAQITNPVLEGQTGSNTAAAESGSLLGGIISALLSFIMLVGALFTLINIIQAGISWISSAGESGKIEEARSRLTNAILGLIILSASYAIWLAIREFLGVSLAIDRLFP